MTLIVPCVRCGAEISGEGLSTSVHRSATEIRLAGALAERESRERLLLKRAARRHQGHAVIDAGVAVPRTSGLPLGREVEPSLRGRAGVGIWSEATLRI